MCSRCDAPGVISGFVGSAEGGHALDEGHCHHMDMLCYVYMQQTATESHAEGIEALEAGHAQV